MNKVQNRSAYYLEDLDLLGDSLSLSFSLVYVCVYYSTFEPRYNGVKRRMNRLFNNQLVDGSNTHTTP